MQNNNKMLMLLLLGGGAFYFINKKKNNSSPKLKGEIFVDDVQTVAPGSQDAKVFEEQIDGVVDVGKSKLNVRDAIDRATEFAGMLGDAKVMIVNGAKKIGIVRNGKKKVKATTKRRVKNIKPRKPSPSKHKKYGVKKYKGF